MEVQEFRRRFESAGKILPVILKNGDQDLAVGLNGSDTMVLHKSGYHLLTNFEYSEFMEALVEQDEPQQKVN